MKTVADSRNTQRGKILALLIAAHGDWVPLPKIQACAAQYAARLFELRRAGFPIPPPRMEIRQRTVAHLVLPGVRAGLSGAASAAIRRRPRFDNQC